MASWLPIPQDSHFSLLNIPFGISSHPASCNPQVSTRIGDHVLNLSIFATNSGFSSLLPLPPSPFLFSNPTLNAFASVGQKGHVSIRTYLQEIFSAQTPYPELLKDNHKLRKECLFPVEEVTMHLPMQIGDYTDFYSGLNHAYNVGVLFRGAANALQPNYTHLPVGYHGRASSIVVSGTEIRRPHGQILESPQATTPIFAASRKLDIELELGAFLCRENKMGSRVGVDEAGTYVFGYVLLNDWSARDIQAWEYVPLGPFGSKNFGTTISPWVVLAGALEPFKTTGLEFPQGREGLLGYLREEEERNVFDIKLEVDLITASTKSTTITKTNGSNLLWSFPQMIAHHSVTGCPMKTGDLLGSGTISGKAPGSEGSLLEQTQNGKIPISLSGSESRKFLENGDEINIRGWCGGESGSLVGFGDCRGKIVE